MFNHHSPKPDNIKAVKLTEDNLHDVGGRIFAAGYAIEVVDGILKVDVGNQYFSPGTWIVEEYDFRLEKIAFRRATSTEREKYDLR